MKKTCEAYEWLHFYDKLQTAVYHDQIGECIGYMPYSAQGFHELFAQEKNESQRSLERKRDSWEVFSLYPGGIDIGIRKRETESRDYRFLDEQSRWTNEANVQSKRVCRRIHFPRHQNHLTRSQACRPVSVKKLTAGQRTIDKSVRETCAVPCC